MLVLQFVVPRARIPEWIQEVERDEAAVAEKRTKLGIGYSECTPITDPEEMLITLANNEQRSRDLALSYCHVSVVDWNGQKQRHLFATFSKGGENIPNHVEYREFLAELSKKIYHVVKVYDNEEDAGNVLVQHLPSRTTWQEPRPTSSGKIER